MADSFSKGIQHEPRNGKENEKNQNKFKKFLDFFKIYAMISSSNTRKEIPLMMNPAVLSSRFSHAVTLGNMTEI